MSRRRLPIRAPIDLPVMMGAEGSNDTTWERFFTDLSQYVYRWDKYAVTFNPTSVSANTTSEQTVTINGVTTEDFVTVSKPTHTAGLGIVNVRVSAANTIAITFINTTGSPIDPPSEIYTFKVEKI